MTLIAKYLKMRSVENRRSKIVTRFTASFNYLRPQKVMPESEEEYVSAQSLDSAGLSWQGASAEQLNFMKQVYEINLARSSSRGNFTSDIPSAELGPIEGRQLQINAAESCVQMIQTVREAISVDGVNVHIGLTSAYRSASHQFSLWNDYFRSQYYPNTQVARQKLAAGGHGEDAAEYLAKYIRVRIAMPGYSKHNNGLAIDIKNTENGKILRNRTNETATNAWRKTWLWSWLSDHAESYQFFQNTHIDEPWHWEYRA